MDQFTNQSSNPPVPELPPQEPRPALPNTPPAQPNFPPPPPNLPFAAAPANEPLFQPTAPVGQIETLEQAPPHKSGGIIKVVIAIVAILGLGALGYFVAYPMFTSEDAAPTPAPSTAASPLPSSPIRSHQSFFVVPATQETPLTIEPVSAEGIADALRQIGERGMPPDSLEEIVMRDPRGSQIPFPAFLGAFGVLDPADLAAWFENDFTAFLYYDAKGIWPGYLAKVKPDANRTDLMAALSGLENVPLRQFFLEDPGAFGPFKDGNVFRRPNRYAPGTLPGAAFEYALVDNYVIISTSYPGLQAALQQIGIGN